MKFKNPKRQKRYEEMKYRRGFFLDKDIQKDFEAVTKTDKERVLRQLEDFANGKLKRPRSKRLIKSRFRRFIIDVYIKFYSILYKLKLYKPKN